MDVLATLELCKLLALEKHLERLPYGGRCRERTVHVNSAKREAGADGLVDVDNCRENVRTVEAKMRRRMGALLLMLFQLCARRISRRVISDAQRFRFVPERVEHGRLPIRFHLTRAMLWKLLLTRSQVPSVHKAHPGTSLSWRSIQDRH